VPTKFKQMNIVVFVAPLTAFGNLAIVQIAVEIMGDKTARRKTFRTTTKPA